MGLKIDKFIHYCVIQEGPAEGNTYEHDVDAYEVENHETCQYCGETLATPNDIALHVYKQLTED